MKFSLKWFRSKRDEELETLRVEEQFLKNELLKKEIAAPQQSLVGDYTPVPEKPYRKRKLVDKVLTIILKDGGILSKSNATIQDYENVGYARTEQDLYKIASSVKADEEQERKKEQEQLVKDLRIVEGFEVLKGLSDFEVDGNTVYLKGIKRSLPPLLVTKFASLFEKYQGIDTTKTDEYIGLKRFFMWCCLNPRAEVVDTLYTFLSKNGMKITKQGFFVALRNVSNVKGNDKQLVDFITNSYHKIKAVWKKKPSDYTIFQNDEGEYGFTADVATYSFQSKNNRVLGNLEELYKDLPNMTQNRFTDDYTHTFDIRIGQAVSMKPEECSWSTASCAEKGLHFAGHTAPYVLCGDTTVFTLHNPMKVVGIGPEKGRCWEYLPFMTTSVEEADEIMNSGDFDFLQLDEQYAVNELENLAEKAKNGFAVESKKYEFNLPSISTTELTKIVKSLEEMKDTISNRVNKV